jgi:predicted AlkP superfamily pyrophosphatase or phosphodiesterase
LRRDPAAIQVGIAGGQKAALSADEVELLVDAYDAEIRFVDEQLRRLFDGLDAKGLLEETLVIVTADHGEEFREHGRISHSPAVYDELVGVPLLVADPGRTLPATFPGWSACSISSRRYCRRSTSPRRRTTEEPRSSGSKTRTAVTTPLSPR